MKILVLGEHHVVERRLAAAATSAAGLQDLTAEERTHLDSCARCRRLLEGHRRAERLLRSSWGPVASPPMADALPGRTGPGIGRLGLGARVSSTPALQLAAVLAVAVLVFGGLLWLRGQQVGPEPTASPSGSAAATPSLFATPRPSEYPAVAIPEALERPIPLPAGGAISEGQEIFADGDWILTNLEFFDQPNGHRQQLYAIDIATGTIRRLADHYGEGGVSAGRAAWADLGCVYAAQEPVGGNADVCTSWKVHLTDLATGTDTVIASGKVTDSVSTVMSSYGTGEFVAPRAAISADTLAYTTGDLGHGFVMHLRSLLDGAERTIGLGGMVDAIRWTGDGFAWVENADLRSDDRSFGYFNPYYYTSNRLMILPSGATIPRVLGAGNDYQGTGPFVVAAGGGRVLWLTPWANPGGTGDSDVWMASGPGWTATRPLPGLTASGVAVSDGWIGWHRWYMGPDTFLVLRPGDSTPHLVSGCYGMSGGLLLMVNRDPSSLASTRLSAVRIADLP